MAARNPNGISAATGPLTNVTIVLEEKEEETGSFKNEIWTILTREARAVSVWALISPLIRLIALEPLISQACMATDGETCPSSSSNTSALAGWLLTFFPRSVAKSLAPGFVFASAWCVNEYENVVVICALTRIILLTDFLPAGSCLLSVITVESFQTFLFAYVKPSWGE